MKGQALNGLHMVNIMAKTTIKREIETTKNTVKTTKKATCNTFKLNEKTMTLTLELQVEWNNNHSVLKAKNLSKVEGKEYQKMVFVDCKGNEVYLFKTGFNYEPVIKDTKISKDSLDTSKLSDEEQKVLALLMKKMSK